MQMDSHGSVSIMKKQSQHKTTGQSLWRVLLSARSELHSHPLAGQARACGRLTKAEGLERTMAPIVTTGVSIAGEKTFSHVILVLGGHVNLFCIVPRKIVKLCVSSLRQGHAIFTVLRKNSCAGTMLILQPVTTFLELCM